jgi:hypothetical protein
VLCRFQTERLLDCGDEIVVPVEALGELGEVEFGEEAKVMVMEKC